MDAEAKDQLGSPKVVSVTEELKKPNVEILTFG